jgi:hypothetical protein
MTFTSAQRASALRVDAQETTRVTAGRALLFFAFLTAVLTWPQVLHPFSVPDNVDSYFSLWRLAWIAHQLPLDPMRLFDGNIFYPARDALAYSDAILLQGAIAAPLVWLGIPVVLVYNLLLAASFVLCALGIFLLVRDLSGRSDAALLSGIVFAFATTRFDHYFHLELLWAQWMPLALWALHRTIRTGRLRDGLLAGVFIAALGFSCVYYTVFFATALVVVAPVLLTACPRDRRWRATLVLAAGVLLAAVALIPYMLAYRAARGEVGERDAGLAVLYGAGPKHYIAVTPGNLVYGRFTAPLGRHEKRLFPGAIALVLAGFALWRRFDRTRLVYLLLAAVAAEITFGYRALLFMWLRDHVMLYRGLRVPARAGHLVLLAVAVLAGLGAARLAAWLQQRRQAWRGPVIACLGGLMVCEYLMAPLPLIAVETSAPPAYAWLRQQPAGVVVELPLAPPVGGPSYDAQFQYLSTFHWHPIVNGYSGAEPAWYHDFLRQAQDFPSDTSLAALRNAGARYLVLHERLYGRERYEAATRALDQRQDLLKYGPFVDGAFAIRVYDVGGK